MRNTLSLVMNNKGYTKVSDLLIDIWLKDLSEAELKTLLIIIRQTIGWNKARDKIGHVQFTQRSGLSKRSITTAIESLSNRNFIKITDARGQSLSAQKRRYKTEIYYETTDFTKAVSSIIEAKLDNTQTHNLPLTIYNTYKQQKTHFSLSGNKQNIKKQSDRERIECIEKRAKNISCSCFRCT